MTSLATMSDTFGVFIESNNNYETIEEKLKVDRKKFEVLLDSEDSETAETFFGKIMSELPSVVITWPMKLKAGTKSKKDPHVKISGIPSMVEKARMKILERLDPHRDRVTLKIDIDWMAHSHIIGKSGQSIQNVMDKTGCHVHFPDANRTNGNEKSNQVSIAGTPSAVKEARIAIRDLLPVIVMFTLLLKPGNRSFFLDRLNKVIQLVEKMIKIQITVRFNAQTYSKSDLPMITILVRGVYRDCNLIRTGTEILFNFMDEFFIKGQITYQINTEISGHHHNFVIGVEESNLKSLMRTTGTTITFPDQSESLDKQDIISRLTHPCLPEPQLRNTTVTIKGETVASVLMAFQLLELHLPLTLTFDLREGQDINTQTIEVLSNDWNVSISVKPKPKQKTKTIWIKAAEKDEWKLFEVRRLLIEECNPKKESLVTVGYSPDSNHSVWHFRGSDHIIPADDSKLYDSVRLTASPNTFDTFDKAPGAERSIRKSSCN